MVGAGLVGQAVLGFVFNKPGGIQVLEGFSKGGQMLTQLNQGGPLSVG